MMNIIEKLLELFLKEIKSGNSILTLEELEQVIELLRKINCLYLNKTEAARYIGKSKSTLDNYINKGLIPKGIKHSGSNLLVWNKLDLEKFKQNVQ